MQCHMLVWLVTWKNVSKHATAVLCSVQTQMPRRRHWQRRCGQCHGFHGNMSLPALSCNDLDNHAVNSSKYPDGSGTWYWSGPDPVENRCCEWENEISRFSHAVFSHPQPHNPIAHLTSKACILFAVEIQFVSLLCLCLLMCCLLKCSDTIDSYVFVLSVMTQVTEDEALTLRGCLFLLCLWVECILV